MSRQRFKEMSVLLISSKEILKESLSTMDLVLKLPTKVGGKAGEGNVE